MSLSPSRVPAAPALHPFVPAPVPSATRGRVACTLALRHAGRRDAHIDWELLGAEGLPVLLVAGGISADRHVAAGAAFDAAGWWDAQVGEGKALDPRRVRVLAIDWLGADGTLDAPIDPADQADAIARVLDALGIAALEGFIGASYGAMVGLQFAARHPRRLRRLCAISGTHRAHPYASAWRALQRQAVALGALQCDEADGLALARQLALLSYRTPEEFDARFAPAEVVAGRVRVGAEDYLRHCGAKYVARTSPTAFLRLSESIDLQRLDPAGVRVAVDVVAVAEDRLVPVADARALAAALPDARLHVLHSHYGHDAFLKEDDAISRVLADFLSTCRRTEIAA
ncbi:MAG: homoserine O-succinyltransferase [Lysobacter sp.]|nr:homoserine O-succinyltransferase [Lysobacter sp.]